MGLLLSAAHSGACIRDEVMQRMKKEFPIHIRQLADISLPYFVGSFANRLCGCLNPQKLMVIDYTVPQCVNLNGEVSACCLTNSHGIRMCSARYAHIPLTQYAF
eukprot:1195788-Prorocentrum_minimum.AAC.8